MHKQANSKDMSRVERGLELLYGAAAPDAAFVIALEQQIKDRAAQINPGNPQLSQHKGFWARMAPFRTIQHWFAQRRWAMAALGLLIVLALTLAAIGPQQVWAGVQRLLQDYIPGLGFINLEQAWALAEPVEIAREGVVLRVAHVVASPEQTVVQIEAVQGIAPEMYPSPRTIQGSEALLEAYREFEAFLRLRDGTRLPLTAKSLRAGKGTLAFPALSPGTNARHLTLELPRLPLLTAGVAPEDWEIALRLRPATTPPDVQMYALRDASDTHEGITLRALEVAHGLEETAVHAQVTWDPAMGQVWMPSTTHPGLSSIELRDSEQSYPMQDLQGWAPVHGQDARVLFGERSPSIIETREADEKTAPRALVEEMWVFEPVVGSPHSLTLQLDWFSVYIPTEALSFTIDLGDNPQAGDRWPLDIHLQVGGLPFHITEARLAGLSAREAEDYPEAAWKLYFTVIPGASGGQFLNRVSMTTASFHYSVGSGGRSRNWDIEPGQSAEPVDDPITSWIYLTEIPADPFKIQVFSANAQVRGPWIVSWDIPN